MGLDLRATVNVSVYDLLYDHFDTRVADVLGHYGVPARQLDIEITERALVEETLRPGDARRGPGRLAGTPHRPCRVTDVDAPAGDY